MSEVTIKICFGDMGMPSAKDTPKQYKSQSLVDKIKETIQFIKDEPYECKKEFAWLLKMRDKLLGKASPEAQKLAAAIDEAINKLNMRMPG